jgi:hypothetical protein
VAVEALHHAIRLRVARRREAVLDHDACARHVEGVLAAGPPILVAKRSVNCVRHGFLSLDVCSCAFQIDSLDKS